MFVVQSEVSYDESSDETQPETCGMGIDRSFNLRNRGEETQKPSSEMEIDSETSSEYGDDTSDMVRTTNRISYDRRVF